jgi:hypothetical protein
MLLRIRTSSAWASRSRFSEVSFSVGVQSGRGTISHAAGVENSQSCQTPGRSMSNPAITMGCPSTVSTHEGPARSE